MPQKPFDGRLESKAFEELFNDPAPIFIAYLVLELIQHGQTIASYLSNCQEYVCVLMNIVIYLVIHISIYLYFNKYNDQMCLDKREICCNKVTKITDIPLKR